MEKTELAFNELPEAPSGGVLGAAIEACKRANRYPEWDASSLRKALADHYGLEPDWVIVSSGSAVVIHQIMIASGQGEIIFGWPNFGDFPRLAAGLRMPIRKVALKKGATDLQGCLRVISEATSMIILCTPHAPTGAILTQEAIADFLEKVPSNVIVLIDEAYGEFTENGRKARSLDFVRKYENVVVSRTFSKTYGLAGLRVGYAMAQPLLAEKIRAAGTPFPIALPAQMAALQALKDYKKHYAIIAMLTKERDRMIQLLRGLGHEVAESHGNFIWLPMASAAERIAKELEKHNIVVKPFVGYGLRISVGTSDDTDRLIAAWRQLNI